MKRTCFSALSRDITSSHKIWRGGMRLHVLVRWTHSHLEGRPGSTQRPQAQWVGNGLGVVSSGDVAFREWSNRAHSAFSQIALSSWDLAEMSHCGTGLKVDKRTCFSPEYCSLRHGCLWKGCISMAFGPIFPLWKDVECLYCGPTFQPSHNSHTVSPPNPRVLHLWTQSSRLKIFGKNSKKFQETVLEFAPHQELLSTVFTTLQIAFTLY